MEASASSSARHGPRAELAPKGDPHRLQGSSSSLINSEYFLVVLYTSLPVTHYLIHFLALVTIFHSLCAFSPLQSQNASTSR